MQLVRKFLFYILLFGIVAQLLMFAPKVLEQDSSPIVEADIEAMNSEAEQVMQGVRLVESREDTKDWEMQAKSAQAFRSGDDWKLETVQIVFYGEDSIEYRVQSDAAEINVGTKDMNIFGNVKMTTSNDFQFGSENVLYHAKDRNLFSPKSTQFASPPDKWGNRLSLSADKVDTDLDKNQVLVQGNVFARKRIQNKSDVIVKSEEATFNLDTRQSNFSGNVVIDYETAKLRGPVASLIYDDKQKIFSELKVTGGTTVKDQNKSAQSRNLEVNFPQNFFRLTGNPRVIQDGDELIGDEILLLDGGKRVKVKSAKAQIDDLKRKK